MSSIKFHNNSEYSRDRQKQIENTARCRLSLGQFMSRDQYNRYIPKGIAYHVPSPSDSSYESIYNKGLSGSGKTWGGYSLAGQTFFAEKRTWIIFDTKRSYIGNTRPNIKFKKQLEANGLFPMGIPPENMHVISPKQYIDMAASKDPDEIRRSWITAPYRVPLRFCSLHTMFEITNQNKNAQYATTFNEVFKQIIAEEGAEITLEHINQRILEILSKPEYARSRSIIKQMLARIEDMDSHIESGVEWSSVGKALMKAKETAEPQWIVVTFALGDTIDDQTNFAMMSAILIELKVFAEKAKTMNWPVKLGVMIDELHAFTKDKKSSTRYMIHDLIHMWGRTNKIIRLVMTQFDSQLDKEFRDTINLKNYIGSGTYSFVNEFKTIPTPGTITHLNRQMPNKHEPEKPILYPRVLSCPPLFEVESDMYDNNEWTKWAKRYYRKEYIDND